MKERKKRRQTRNSKKTFKDKFAFRTNNGTNRTN